MIKSVLALLSALLLTMEAAAQSKQFEGKPSAISGIDFFSTNFGLFAVNTVTKSSGFIVPRGSNKAYLFGGGLWFGARKWVRDSSGTPVWRSLVFLAYNPNSVTGWATPGEAYLPDTLSAHPILYRSGDYDRTTGEVKTVTVPPGKAPNWPLWSKMGNVIRSLNAGTFEPVDTLRRGGGSSGGRYMAPAFVPGVDEQLVARYHDRDLTSYEANAFAVAEGYPIGLQIQQNIYAWGVGKYQHTVIIQYDIINMSGDTLRNCVAAQASDPDIGSPDNDHVEYYAPRPELRTGYAWTDPDSAGPYDTLAMIMLEAPVVNGDGFIDNTRRRDFRLQGAVGSFPHWTSMEDPHTSTERYDFMTNGTFTADQGPDEQRAMMASRLFSMRPGDTAHFAVAYAVLDGSFYRTWHGDDTDMISVHASNPRLEAWAISLTNDYYSGDFNSIPAAGVEEELAADRRLIVVPNPAAGTAQVRFAVATRGDVRLRVVNSLGVEMLARGLGMRSPGEYAERLDIGELPPGVYLVVVESGSSSRTTKLNIVR